MYTMILEVTFFFFNNSGISFILIVSILKLCHEKLG